MCCLCNVFFSLRCVTFSFLIASHKLRTLSLHTFSLFTLGGHYPQRSPHQSHSHHSYHNNERSQSHGNSYTHGNGHSSHTHQGASPYGQRQMRGGGGGGGGWGERGRGGGGRGRGQWREMRGRGEGEGYQRGSEYVREKESRRQESQPY